ncbi:hypothetical protein ACEWY4_006571 [Coilia grayii]|uniref:Uncharacterized protein n=1 Tax=Coilia grayii TaxID=363190 RepID=A0ABD1KDU4_9TELE
MANKEHSSNVSLLQSMLQRLRKDDPSSPCSSGERWAKQNALSGGDNDQQASSRNLNTQPTTEQGNLRYSPNIIPKWERRQLFLIPCALDTVRNPKEGNGNKILTPCESDEQQHGKGTKSWSEMPGFVSERKESMSSQEITDNISVHEKPSHDTDVCHTETPELLLVTKESSGPDGPVWGNAPLQGLRMDCYGVSTEDTEIEAYEDVVFLSSMAEFPSRSVDLPTKLDLSHYRVRKVNLSSDTPVQTKNALVTSTETRSEAMESMSDDQIIAGVDSEDMNRRYSADVAARHVFFNRGAAGSTVSHSSLGKQSDKPRVTNDKKRNLTGKLKEKWRVRHERTQGAEGSQENEALYLEPDPLEEAMPSPTSQSEAQGLCKNKTCLQRTFTLRDFKLDLGSMNLMEEVFTGEEWSKYLPAQEGPSLEEETDQSDTNSLHSWDDNQLTVTDKLQHDSRPESHSGSGHFGTENADIQKKAVEGNQDDPGVEPNIYIYAIPTEELVNPPRDETNPSSQHEESGDIYDYVEYMIPMPANWKTPKTFPILDFSVIKTQELLDNSMLKSRISLGKKRKHRPPGKKKKERPYSTFYNIPSAILQPQPQPSPPTLSSPEATVFTSSVFYSRPSLTDSQDYVSSQSLGSVAGKSKPRWKGLFPRTKGKPKH